MVFGSSNDPVSENKDPVARMAEEGSQIFLGDLIHSIQSSLDIAADAAERKHAFSMVRFDATATLSFKLNDTADLQESEDASGDTEVKPRTGFAHRLLSFFTRKPAENTQRSHEDTGKDQQEKTLQESGTITLHMQFQPQRGRAAARPSHPSPNVNTPVNVSHPVAPAQPSQSVMPPPQASVAPPPAADNPFGSGGQANTASKTSESANASSGQASSTSSNSDNPFA